MVKMQSPHTVSSNLNPLPWHHAAPWIPARRATCGAQMSCWLFSQILLSFKAGNQQSTLSLLEKAAAHEKATHTASLKNKQNSHPFTSYIFTKQTLYARHCSKHGCPTPYRTAMLLIRLWAQHSAVWGPFTCEPHFGSQHQWVMVVIAMESCGSTFQGHISLRVQFLKTQSKEPAEAWTIKPSCANSSSSAAEVEHWLELEPGHLQLFQSSFNFFFNLVKLEIDIVIEVKAERQ